jgi:hypothetical protein
MGLTRYGVSTRVACVCSPGGVGVAAARSGVAAAPFWFRAVSFLSHEDEVRSNGSAAVRAHARSKFFILMGHLLTGRRCVGSVKNCPAESTARAVDV